MNANQVYSLINAVSNEALGKSAITVKDTSTLVSLGKTVLATDTTKDIFYNKLADRIGRVYIKARAYMTDARKGMVKQPLDFGIALQKIQVKDIASAKNNDSWGNQVNPFSKQKDTTAIEQRIFSVLGVWEVETKIIYDHQLNSAFKNEVNMASFVNMIFTDMYNAMEFQLEQASKLCKATAIATCIKSNKGTVKRNLLAEYNLVADTVLTVDNCLTDVSFLKYATKEINLAIKRMQKMTQLFTPADGYTRFSKKEDIIIDIIDLFAVSEQSYLQADTFHKELVSLPLYNEVDNWQGAGTSYAFEDVTSINVQCEGDQEATQQSGIIAFVRDADACGIMIDNIRTKSIYNPASECNNYFHKADWGMYVDDSEQMIVFYVAE